MKNINNNSSKMYLKNQNNQSKSNISKINKVIPMKKQLNIKYLLENI